MVRSSDTSFERREGESLEAPVGLFEQRRGDREVDGGRDRIDMSHESRQLMEPTGRVNPFPIPPQQARDSKRVSEVVQSWRRDALWNRELERGDQVVKHLAGRARV